MNYAAFTLEPIFYRHLSMSSYRNQSIDLKCSFKLLSCDKIRSAGKRKVNIIDTKENHLYLADHAVRQIYIDISLYCHDTYPMCFIPASR